MDDIVKGGECVKIVKKKLKMWISKCPYDMKDEWVKYGYDEHNLSKKQ